MRSQGLMAAMLVGVAALAGCSGPGIATEPPDPCNQTTEFDFIGPASQAQLGLSGPGDPTAGQVGMAWVTSGPVNWGGPDGPAFPGPAPAMRAVCIQFDDGSGMGASVDDDWEQPDGIFDGSEGAPEAADTNAGPLVVLVLVLALVAVSVVVFAREGRPGDGA